jgi:hypothetical protein
VVVDEISRRRHDRPLPSRVPSPVPAVLCGLAIVSTLVLLHTIEYRAYVRTGEINIIQGRYGLMVLPAVLALPALMLRRFVARVPVGATVFVMSAAIAVLQVISMARIIDRFYL